MADNVGITPGTGAIAAADDIAGALHQRVKVTLGADGVSDGDVSSANPIPVRLDQGPEAIVSNNGSLQVDATQTAEQATELLNATGVFTGDEPVQLVGLHPSFPLPIDTGTPMPIAGQTAEGGQKQVSVGPNGGVSPADMRGPWLLDYLHPAATTVDLNLVLNTTGFNSLAVHIFANPGSIFRVLGSHDSLTWTIIEGFNLNTSTLQFIDGFNTPTTILVYPAHMRFVKFQLTGTPGGRFRAHVYMRSAPYGFGQRTQGVNLTQVLGAAIVATTPQIGANVFGPTAPNAAHSTNAPVQMSGSDGTNVRRILTDTSGNTRTVGPAVAGTPLINATNAAFAPQLTGMVDLEGKVQRVAGSMRGQLNVRLDDATTITESGVVEALADVVRELKLLNARIADLPYWLGVGTAMPEDASGFRDDPTIFNH